MKTEADSVDRGAGPRLIGVRQYALLLLAVGAALSLGVAIGFTARLFHLEAIHSEPWFTLTRLLGLGIALRFLNANL